MMKDFTFFNPVKVFFGRDQIGTNLANTLGQYGKKVLMVYGGNSIHRTGVYDKVMKELSGFEVFELSGIDPNPDVSSIRQGVKICKEQDIDVILAIGGGSVIDASKWTAAAACVDHDAWDFFCKKTTIDKALPLVTILTIAATGSEMNCGGVISNRELCKKVGRSSPLIFPKASFLDPEFTFTVSRYQTASGSIDILSHIMEVYFNKQETMEMLDGIMESVMRTVIKYGLIALDSPDDYEARANLMWSASWAINGFINGPVFQPWNCHTIEHELSARYGVTHGHGLAILLPRWLKYVYTDEARSRYEGFVKNVLGAEPADDVAEQVSDMLSELFFEKFGLSSELKDLDVPSDDLADIGKTLCQNGPVKGFADLDENDIYEILKMSY